MKGPNSGINLEKNFEKTAILGVGLIGASLALSLRENARSGSIVGFGRTERHLESAKKKGIIDAYELDPAKACEGADLIVLATPVGMFAELIKKIIPVLKKGALIIDVGSVKGKLVGEMESLMPEGVSFVGCHPIAGSDRSGIDAASADLFAGALSVITKTPKTPEAAFEAASALWKAMGAEVRTMSPERHDRVYALVSHLPHLVAYALVNAVADEDESALDFAGQGFRDTTRVAGSSPEMWRDIVMINRENLIDLLEAFKSKIEKLADILKKEDGEAVEREFERAKKIREKLNKH